MNGDSMSPQQRHAGGRPRTANSVLYLVERWGISEKTARRLAARKLDDDAMAVLVHQSKRLAASRRGEIAAVGKYTGGMRALGMRSRIPAVRACSGHRENREGQSITKPISSFEQSD
jgi:hypothetical protein